MKTRFGTVIEENLFSQLVFLVVVLPVQIVVIMIIIINNSNKSIYLKHLSKSRLQSALQMQPEQKIKKDNIIKI